MNLVLLTLKKIEAMNKMLSLMSSSWLQSWETRLILIINRYDKLINVGLKY